MKPFTQFLIFTALLFAPLYLKSTHIIGGTTSYRVVDVTSNSVTLDLALHLYKDVASPAQLDDNISIGFYGYKNEEYTFILKQEVVLNYTVPIEFENIEGCPDGQFNYIDGIYTTQITIPTSDYDYYTFAYQRCCRSTDLNNILFPSDTGIAITMDIYPKAFEFPGAIPPLSSKFPIQAEPGKNNSFDISIEDPLDKEYFLSVPKASGGILGSSEPGDPFDCKGIIPDPEDCKPDYADVLYVDPQNPYGEGAIVSLDKESGILDINIPETSKTLFGVTIDRYINDELVCRSRQQFVLNNFTCLHSNTKNTLDPDLVVWPIPVNDLINSNIPLKQVNIFDVYGDNQSLRQNNQFSTKFDISHLSSGLYFMRGLTLDGKWITKKIIKS